LTVTRGKIVTLAWLVARSVVMRFLTSARHVEQAPVLTAVSERSAEA
jgi:hypothetical protein